MNRPFFLVTMDAEGDNLWENQRAVSTRNAAHVHRFQSLCELFGLPVTWLTNHEMANCPIFVEFARDMLKRGTGEIGMHLHAWDSPPAHAKDTKGQVYLTEYPEEAMVAKVDYMTGLLQDRFGTAPVSHRAGRWSFDDTYARVLSRFGYLVDTSVTPHVTWKHVLGDIDGAGGADYRGFPEHPYFIRHGGVSEPGTPELLEVPVTVTVGADGRTKWLRPNGSNIRAMLGLIEQFRAEGRPCLVFMLHSSELMPGGSPTFAVKREIERLYDDLGCLFDAAKDQYRGATLREFYFHFLSREPGNAGTVRQ
jgi:peptidoglycan/xylan/chitin deacetylase (PgdA/CDA1 family)